MKKKQYQIDIQAPAARVVQTMLGKDTYRQWTSDFSPTSDFEGGWNKGDKIRFTSVSKEGEKGGMIAEIAEHIPEKFISIRHYGMLEGDTEITEGPAVESWAGSLENYSFEERDGITTVTVDIDTEDTWADHFDATWPKALNKLKALSEQ